MNKLLITIATLFAYSIIFAQTWNTGTGAWISPLSKNIGIQKSLQVGDNVGTDSLWCKTDLNYFEGNVGIGTTTPEAKLHVSMSDTTGVEIAHFENNSDNAIMTLHSHADSSAILLLQTGNKSAVFALTGVTGEVVLTNGLAVNAIEIDTTGSVTIPDLAGSGQNLVTALADGTLDRAVGLSAFIIDGAENMYAGTDAMASLTSGGQNLVIGISAGANITDEVGNTVVGWYADVATGASLSTAIGFQANCEAALSIALGVQSVTTAEHQFVVGSSAGAGFIDNVFFGDGVVSSTPKSTTINASGGSGTNIEGAIMTLAGGKATGNATTGGYISLSTSDAGASGTTLQSLSEKVRITKGGDLVVLNAANGIVLKDAAGTPHYWRVTISTLGVLTTTDLGTSIP